MRKIIYIILKKMMAKCQWQISQFLSDEKYTNKHGGPICIFEPQVIDNAKKWVSDQEKTNPEWDTWIEEWESED